MSHGAPLADSREFAFSDEEFRFLSGLVSQQVGIVFGENKKAMVYARLTRRLRALGLPDFRAYCALVEESDEEKHHLINALTTNLTRFFREKHHFDHLRTHLLEPLAAKPPARKHLRIWSAACSSGMEPYSLAMTVRSVFPDLTGWDARILATDIDTNMLHLGETGLYDATQLTHIPPPYDSQKFFTEKDGEISMAPELKKLIAFRRLNLLEEWPMRGTFDAIFCRNVTIYFDKPTQKDLYERMAELLNPQGWLYIGHSENLTGLSDRFELAGRTTYRKVR